MYSIFVVEKLMLNLTRFVSQTVQILVLIWHRKLL